MTEIPLPEQQRFIDRALSSHALLVAGPGTGKTRTLAFTSEALVESGQATGRDVSVLTLTRSLATDLTERIPHGRASTLHSFALWHLNRLGEAWGRRVADPWEEENLVCTDLVLGVKIAFDARCTRTEVKDFLKAMGRSFRDGQDEPSDLTIKQQQLLQIFNQQRELFRYRLMDELVMDLVNLIEQGAQIEALPTHVLVDEYQDLTPGELHLLQLLAERGTRIVATGDDRQSIYGFREADERALHRYPEVYGVDFDVLTQSWRCPKRVCDFAEAIAEPLPPLPSFERPPLTAAPNRPDEGEIQIIVAPSPIAEARWVMNECTRLIEQEGYSPSEIMIVVAGYIDGVMPNLEQACGEDDRPFELYDPRGRDPSAETLAVRLLGAGARILMDEHDHMAWRALVWATPGLGPKRLARILSADKGDYIGNLEAVAQTDSICGRPLNAGRSLRERLIGEEIVSGSDIVTSLAEALSIDQLELDPLEAIITQLGREATPAELVAAVVELSQETLISPSDRPTGIAIRTIFGAKGLQAPVVFLVNAIQPCFTARGSVADGIRRLYVAVTRTERRLYVTAPRFLGFQRLAHMVGSRVGGLASSVRIAAQNARIGVESV